MDVSFRRVGDFERGTLYSLLVDAYGCDERWHKSCEEDWRWCDDFLFNNPDIADKCSFVTVLSGEPIGFVVWDPRKLPETVELGHNCIAAKHKGNGYGRAQLAEAVKRIKQSGARRIIVTTNEQLVAAQHNYESVGFVKVGRRKHEKPGFLGDYIDYEYRGI